MSNDQTRHDDQAPAQQDQAARDETQDQVADLGAKRAEEDEQVKGGMIRQFEY